MERLLWSLLFIIFAYAYTVNGDDALRFAQKNTCQWFNNIYQVGQGEFWLLSYLKICNYALFSQFIVHILFDAQTHLF